MLWHILGAYSLLIWGVGVVKIVFSKGYNGAQNDYTHILLIWELISQLHRTSVTQGFLAGILLCNSGVFIGTFCECADYTH